MGTPDDIAISLIVASHNGAGKLARLFNSVDAAGARFARAELLLVDSASTDGTSAVMEEYAAIAPLPARVIHLKELGQARAQNEGAAASRGSVLAFTDDDCSIEGDYFHTLLRDFDFEQYDYGAGSVVMGDLLDDPRMANTAYWKFRGPTRIEPRSLLPAGIVHGANMLFQRDVFERLGGFDADLGSASDIEMFGRASNLGYTGVLMPALTVLHYPGRPRGSAEADAVVTRYDEGRGCYYASLMLLGEQRVWDLWRQNVLGRLDDPETLHRLEREFRGAADYLRRRIKSPRRLSRGPID